MGSMAEVVEMKASHSSMIFKTVLLLTLAHMGLSTNGCYNCSNTPGAANFDPFCGMHGYQGDKVTANSGYTCYTNVHYTNFEMGGSKGVERGSTHTANTVNNDCYDTGYSITCVCSPDVDVQNPPCNSDLCDHCTS